MNHKYHLPIFSSLLIFSLFFLITLNSVNATSNQIKIGAVSAQGTIAVNETITLQVTILNTFSTNKIRNVGLALPTGLSNQTPLVVPNIDIPGYGFRFVNFTISLNASGDFELLFYESDGYGIGDWKTMHLLVGSFPEALPPSIHINETIYINETIPVDIDQTINVTNTINNFNNYSILVNNTLYNTIVNNITNTIYNNFIVNITQYFNFTQWQEQWQWQNVTIILPSDDLGQNALLLTLAGTGILGVFFMGAAPQSTLKKRKTKMGKTTYESEKGFFGIPQFDRRFKFGLATLTTVCSTAALIFFGIPTLFGLDLLMSAVWGFVLGGMIFIIIMSINHPTTLLWLVPLVDIALWLWYWIAGMLGLIIIIVALVFWVARARHNAKSGMRFPPPAAAPKQKGPPRPGLPAY